MNSAEAELKRRRERGRQAQSAFRKRQAEAKKDRESENSKLKSAIAAILAEVRPGDRPELQARIREASELAGLQVDRSPEGTRRTYSDLASKTDSSGTESESPPAAAAAAAAPTALVHRSPSNQGHWSINDGPDLTIRPDPLNCYPCRQGVAAFLPFLGAGAFTFAGRVFWSLVEKHENDDHSHESNLDCNRRRQILFHSTVVSSDPDSHDSELQRTLVVPDNKLSRAGAREAWLVMLEHRMGCSRAGRICGPAIASAGGHRHQNPEDFAYSSTTGPRAYAKSSRTWLSPMCLERRLRNMVGDEVFAIMANPMLDRWEKSRGQHSLRDRPELIEELIDKLSENVECLGDLGPHWDTAVFDSTFQEWCSSVMGAPGGPNFSSGRERSGVFERT